MDKDTIEKIKAEIEEKSTSLKKNAASHSIFELGFKLCEKCIDICEVREVNKQCFQEKTYYHWIIEQLREDVKKIQLDSNFATETLMGEIAMILIRINRLHRYELVNSDVCIKEFPNYETKISPICEYAIRLQNHLNKLMSKLGIMPLQILSRRTTKIAELLEMELSKMQKETLETKSSGVKLRLKDKRY
jgi:hypothetical protein